MTAPPAAELRRRGRLPATVDPVDGAWPRHSAVLSFFMVVAYAGIVFLRPALPQNLAFVDPVLLLLSLVGLVSMTRLGSRATLAAGRTLPWVWLILLGSIMGLFSVGITEWAVSNMLRTALALLTFFCIWHLVDVTRSERAALVGTCIGLVVTSLALATQASSLRGFAFFDHPNYAGHFTTMASMLLFVQARTWRVKVLALLALMIGLLETASFGAIAMALSMFGVLVIRSLKRSTALLAVALIFVAIFGLFVSAPGVDGLPSIKDWNVSEVISEERFERSQGSRAEIWGKAIAAYAETPWGVGPDGVAKRELAEYRGIALEIHADALGYLVERGILGVIGYIGLWVTIWRSTRPGGIAHVLIVGVLVQGLFRETMHYRHLWLLVGLAAVFDQRSAERDAVHEADAPDPTGDAVGSGRSAPTES